MQSSEGIRLWSCSGVQEVHPRLRVTLQLLFTVGSAASHLPPHHRFCLGFRSEQSSTRSPMVLTAGSGEPGPAGRMKAASQL